MLLLLLMINSERGGEGGAVPVHLMVDSEFL